MNKTVIIIGSVALLGVGAYLYFKGKGKPNEETIGADTTGTGTTNVNPSTGMVIPKVDEVTQVSNSTKNAQEAVTLASQIFELKNKKSRYSNMSLSEFFKTPEGRGHFSFNITASEAFKEKVVKDFDSELKILNDKIVALGFIEVNGSIAKLNL
jgi:hypothetical protein